MYDDELDYKTIIDDVRKVIEKDEQGVVIFEKICCEGQRRRDVIQEESWTDDVFDNGMKRLNRALVKVAKKYAVKLKK